MIGGKQRLIDRLKEFFEEEQRQAKTTKAQQEH